MPRSSMHMNYKELEHRICLCSRHDAVHQAKKICIPTPTFLCGFFLSHSVFFFVIMIIIIGTDVCFPNYSKTGCYVLLVTTTDFYKQFFSLLFNFLSHSAVVSYTSFLRIALSRWNININFPLANSSTDFSFKKWWTPNGRYTLRDRSEQNNNKQRNYYYTTCQQQCVINYR